MKILGISPLDKDATVALVEDGRVLFAAAEERFSRVKQHAGFPHAALEAALQATGTSAAEIDGVAYPFLDWEDEARLMTEALSQASRDGEREDGDPHALRQSIDQARTALLAAQRANGPREAISGLSDPEQTMAKGPLKAMAYRALGTHPFWSKQASERANKRWLSQAIAAHKHWSSELQAGLANHRIEAPLRRSEHHLSHAAGAYYGSGFERALIVTFDGYGSGLAGSISLGDGGKIERLAGLPFPYSLGSFYEMVTSSLGFHPDRHAGKVVGLAAYGDPARLAPILQQRLRTHDGQLRMSQNLNVFFSRHLAERFPMIDVAAAWQQALEVTACNLVESWARKTGCEHLVLAGGVAANVKLNQRLHALPSVSQTFVYPNMGDGGCAAGIAQHISWTGGPGAPMKTAYLGPTFDRAAMKSALDAADLTAEEPADMAAAVAAAIHAGQVVARFDGAMEYGPRSLGNRSILYHAREPSVNSWLNQRLGRTEFMPFAPVTLWEARDRCYRGLQGAEHAAEFMTITCDCTPWMVEHCPAAVHVDGTARPQLLRREANPGYYDIVSAYEALSGIPCLINTSFNMHEEPIVCSPADAVRAFLLGQLDTLAMGPFLVRHPGHSGR
ncbi:MAG: carbamoyltransferase [Pseudohongiellaceae bacterium]